LTDKAHRAGGAERFPVPAVHKSIAGDRTLLGHDDQRLRDVERTILQTAQQPQAQTLSLLRPVPAIGALLRLGLLYAIPALTRFPRVHDGLSACRLVTCTKASARQRYGTTGTQSGQAHLTWACSEAAVRLLRAKPAGQQDLRTLEPQHGSGTALPLLGQQLGRPVTAMGQRHAAFDMDTLLHGSGSGADEPYAARDHHGLSLRSVARQCRGRCVMERGGAQRPFCSAPVACDWPSAPALGARRVSLTWAAPPPRLRRPGERHPCSHPFAQDGTRGQRGF
jgi:transposase IS116/IS110/IS902 family protein